MLLLLPPLSTPLDNGLGRVPGLGWNSDYCEVNCSGPLLLRVGDDKLGAQPYAQNEKMVKHIADYMHSVRHKMASDGSMKTMQELGWSYVNIDANWDLPNRSANGDLVPDPALYPSGLNRTVSYVHSLGLKFGLYGDRGTLDCGRAPGQQGHEVHDALWLGKNKIDWFKSDSCYTTEPGEPSEAGEVTAIIQYEKVRDGFNQSGHPVWWALCDGRKNPPSFYAGPNKYPKHPVGNSLANSARIGPDTGGGWMEVMANLENALPAQQFAGPSPGGGGGYWNDGCLLLTPGVGCNGEGESHSVYHDDQPSDGCMSNRRFRSMYALWTVMSFNLLLTSDFAKLNDYVMSTWTNDIAVGINQDLLGIPARRIDNISAIGYDVLLHNGDASSRDVVRLGSGAGEGSNMALMTVEECGGEPAQQKWVFGQPAAGLVSNNVTRTCISISRDPSNPGDPRFVHVVYDQCAGKVAGNPSENTTASERWDLDGNGQLRSALDFASGPQCATAPKKGSTGVVTLAKCATPASAAQQWKYDRVTQQLTTSQDGYCVTATSPRSKIKQTTMVLGRPLGVDSPHSFAFVFLNNKNISSSVTCDEQCMANAMALLPSSASARAASSATVTYTVQEVWSGGKPTGATVKCSAHGCEKLIVDVECCGGSTYVRMVPQ